MSSLPFGVNFETHLNGGPQGTPLKLRENTANNAANKNNYTLQTKFPHAANKTPATNKIIKRCKKKKFSHTANNTSARCKQRNYTLQKTQKYCVQDDVKDWDLVLRFSRLTTNVAEFSRGCHEN